MFGIIIFSLIIFSLALLFTDAPYFFFGILFVTFSFLIILIKTMWSISVKITDKIHQFLDDEIG